MATFMSGSDHRSDIDLTLEQAVFRPLNIVRCGDQLRRCHHQASDSRNSPVTITDLLMRNLARTDAHNCAPSQSLKPSQLETSVETSIPNRDETWTEPPLSLAPQIQPLRQLLARCWTACLPSVMVQAEWRGRRTPKSAEICSLDSAALSIAAIGQTTAADPPARPVGAGSETGHECSECMCGEDRRMAKLHACPIPARPQARAGL